MQLSHTIAPPPLELCDAHLFHRPYRISTASGSGTRYYTFAAPNSKVRPLFLNRLGIKVYHIALAQFIYTRRKPSIKKVTARQNLIFIVLEHFLSRFANCYVNSGLCGLFAGLRNLLLTSLKDKQPCRKAGKFKYSRQIGTHVWEIPG